VFKVDLERLARELGAPPLTRFAPSPTGYLHLGHVVNAIYTWGITRALGGRVLLRIEDHDRIRSRPQFEAALLEDLDWLGFVPDAGRDPVVRQRDRDQIYEQALATLRTRAHVYACRCSRKEIGGEVYPGTCRHLGLPDGSGPPEGGPHVPGGPHVRTGLRVQLADASGDLLLRDRDGHWTYQFCVVVDDLRQGISLVVRGDDLRGSTPRQIELARLLGRERPPVFVHHPLILKPNGEKVSKAAGDSGVRDLRAAGLSPEEVIGRAAAAVDLIGFPRRIRIAELATLMH
jgi:glutamyl-tRNA synthetase/glutamyl-Q tRNA(Asp) synthetase